MAPLDVSRKAENQEIKNTKKGLNNINGNKTI